MHAGTTERRAVTFDCWGTLIESKDGTKAAEQRIVSLRSLAPDGLGAEDAAALIEAGRRAHFDAWLAGRHFGSAGIARHCAQVLGGDDHLAAGLQRAFEEASLLTEFVVLQGAPKTLEVLAARGLRLALICDTGLTPGWAVKEVLERFGLWAYFDGAAFSDDVGHPKPDARIFHAALREIGVSGQEAIHVGDMLRADISGARQVGMGTVRITAVTPDGGATASVAAGVPLADPTVPSIEDADRVVASHAELLPALSELGVPGGRP